MDTRFSNDVHPFPLSSKTENMSFVEESLRTEPWMASMERHQICMDVDDIGNWCCLNSVFPELDYRSGSVKIRRHHRPSPTMSVALDTTVSIRWKKNSTRMVTFLEEAVEISWPGTMVLLFTFDESSGSSNKKSHCTSNRLYRGCSNLPCQVFPCTMSPVHSF